MKGLFMEILFNNFKMPSNVKQLNQSNLTSKPKDLVNYSYSSPTFKSSKSQITKEVGESILKNLNLTPEAMKEIFSNPKKFKTLLDVLGGLILSAATAITGLIYMEDDNTKNNDTFVKSNKTETETNLAPKVEIKTKAEAESEEDVNIAPETQAKTRKTRKAKKEDLEVGGIQEEKFKRAFRQHPLKEETQYSQYIENNFKGDIELWNANVRLFNQIAGKNIGGAHIYKGEVCKNSNLLKMVLPEIMDAKGDRAKILEIVAKYSALEQTELQANKDETQVKEVNQVENNSVIEKENIKEEKSEFKIKISAGLSRVLNGKDKLISAYKNIIATSQSKKEAEDRLKAVNELLYPWSNKINKELDSNFVTEALRAINKDYSDCLEELAIIYVENFAKNDCSAKRFYIDLANKKYSADAIKNYGISIKKLGLSFDQYNELVNANVTPDNIKKLAEMLHKTPICLNDIKYDNDLLELKLPFDKSLNFYFKAITQAFELVHNEKITLESKEKTEFNKGRIVDELIKDYQNNGICTYPNLIKYLYGAKHIIYNENSFKQHQWEDHFDDLIKVLNDDKLFDPNLFEDHAKMRFLERFVIDKCDWDNIEKDAYKTMRNFVNLLKESLYQNTSIRKYVARYSPSGNPIVGAQIIVKDNDKDIKFTLNNKAKIHTIF